MLGEGHGDTDGHRAADEETDEQKQNGGGSERGTEETGERKQTTLIMDHPGITERFVDLWLTDSLMN